MGFRPWTTEKVLIALDLSDDVVTNSIVVLYDKQLMWEKRTAQSHGEDDSGIDATDARLFTLWARKLLHGSSLDSMELTRARMMLMRYASQLAQAVNETGMLLQ